MSTTKACAGCSTQYAPDLDACPHCGSSDLLTEAGATSRRLPLSVSVRCEACGRGPWQLRLPQLVPGLIHLPILACATCGSGVEVPWPPAEEDMSPKITVNGGATDASTALPSPDADAREPLAGAEAGQGHPHPEQEQEVSGDGSGEALPELQQDDGDELQVKFASDGDGYDGKSLAELRQLATERSLPSHGNKNQLITRLREADSE